MIEKIQNILFKNQDLEYKSFSVKLIPNVEKSKIIGVRAPILRDLAKTLSKDNDILEFINNLPHCYLEENSLHGFIIPYLTKDINEILNYFDKLLPYVDNWATCDTIAPKIFKKYPNIVKDRILVWLKSKNTYTVRFAIQTLLAYYLDDEFDQQDLYLIAEIHTDEYYINMVIAWYYSFALIKQYDATIKLFKGKKLDKWIHNKSIQKAIESKRIDAKTKEYIKKLKIK